MIFNKYTYNDIVKYYRNTIIKVKETEDRLWCVGHITTSEVELTDCDGFVLYMDLSEDYEVDYPLPGRTVYQNGQYACILFRKPAKQYYRGIHPENTAIQCLRSDNKWMNFEFSINKLQEFIDKPCYKTLPEYVDNFSIALNRYFSVSQLGNIFCLTKPVGIAYADNKTVKINPLFKAEFSKFIPKDWTMV